MLDGSTGETESDVAESTIVPTVNERQRLIESYAQYQKTRGKLDRYASTSTYFTHAPKKIATGKVHGLVHRLYRPQLLLQRTREDLKQRSKQKKVDNFDSTHDKYLAKYWRHRQRLAAKQSKRRDTSTINSEESSLPTVTLPEVKSPKVQGNAALAPLPRPRGLPSIVAQEGTTSKRLVITNGGRTLVLQDDDVPSEDSASTPTSTSRAESSVAASVIDGSHHPPVDLAAGVSFVELSSLWLLANPPSELAPTVRGMSIAHSDETGLDLSWLVTRKRVAPKIKEELPSPNRFGRRKYLLKCQQDGASSHNSSITIDEAKFVHQLVADAIEDALRESSAMVTTTSPTKSATSNKNGKLPGVMTTLLDVPLESPSDNESLPTKLNSPRSCLIVLRNGLTLRELLPTPFTVFAKEGSLLGVPQFATEKRYLSKESKRRNALRRVQEQYSALCGEYSRNVFMEMLHDADPNASKEDTSTFSQIVESKKNHQQESNARFADKLDAQVQRTKAMCQKIKAESEKIQEFETQRAAKWRDEMKEREQQRQEKAARLQRVKDDATQIASIHRSKLLIKLEHEDQRRKKLEEARSHARHLEAEAQREDAEAKREEQCRHSRLEELKRAQAAEGIRQKMARIERQKKLSNSLQQRMRYEQELAKLRNEETRRRAEDDILAFRRKYQV